MSRFRSSGSIWTPKRSLFLKALQQDPWDNLDEIVGLILPSPPDRICDNFGIFVTIADGITGLLPQSRLRKDDMFKSGDEVVLMVTAIDKDNVASLWTIQTALPKN